MEDFRKYLKRVSWDDVPYAQQAGLIPYQVIAENGAQTGLFTGYFEPLLRGSFTKKAPFIHAVYAPPPDLVAGVPHVSRGDVIKGALDNKNLELLYVDDAVDLFFAHVQGSAAVQMEDGHIQHIGFAAKSGHPYTAIGKTLKGMDALHLPITMQSIKAWLRANPMQQDTVFSTNASFIFFKLLDGDGPIGASGNALKSEESLAVDDTIWPYGLQVIVATRDPLDDTKPYIRLMRTEDTGTAIRGTIRGDIYFGSGEVAGAKAGAMNAQGRMWVLLPT